MRNFHETAYLLYHIGEDGILEATYKEDVRHIDRALAEEIVADRLEFQRGVSYPLLIQEMGAADITKEARVYFAGEQGIAGLIAIAILAHNWVTYGTGRFILSIQRPAVPVRLFMMEKEARLWLLQQRVAALSKASKPRTIL